MNASVRWQVDEGFLDAAAVLKRLGFAQGREPFTGLWAERDPMGIPGPLYVANDDACGAGADAAPNCVALPDDSELGEFLYRQPSTLYELKQVLEAAEINPVEAFAMDGNDHWTPELVRQWWQRMQPMRQSMRERMTRYVLASKQFAAGQLRFEELPAPLDVGTRRWLRYLEDGAELYLRRYTFFLQHGRAPCVDDALPLIAETNGATQQ